jgi:hypothetical protein
MIQTRIGYDPDTKTIKQVIWMAAITTVIQVISPETLEL